MREKTGSHRFFMGDLQGKRPFGRPGNRLENNIKTVLKEM
jgi:hypothetical protein